MNSAGMSPAGSATPPLPPVTFCVGVSGHRPNRLQQADLALLRAQISRALGAVQDATMRCAVAHTVPLPAVCRVLSPLAEGADRLVAAAALQLGFALAAPLPFSQPQYEADFSAPGSLGEFRRLLAASDAVFELPDVDSPQPRALGYRAAGELILRQCDLLVAIWDGAPAAGIGGTPEMIDRALDARLPVLVIDAAAPHALRLLPARDPDADPLAALTAIVEARLMPSPAQLALEDEYARERWPSRIPVSSYLFTRLLGERRLQLPRTPAHVSAGAEIRSAVLRPYSRGRTRSRPGMASAAAALLSTCNSLPLLPC